MSLAIYSTEFDPQRLHATTDTHPRDDWITEVIGTGDRPLDLVVDTAHDRLLWSFRGDRRTTATRTGYFVADYRHETDEPLFRGFEMALAELHLNGDWTIPYTGDLRWDAGFELWRLPPDWLGLADEERNQLLTQLAADRNDGPGPVEFAVPDYESAFQLVRAVHGSGPDCTIAVGRNSALDADTTIDLLLRPADVSRLTPRSSAAEAVIPSGDQTSTVTDTSDDGSDRFGRQTRQRDDGLGDGLASGVILVVLGFSLYSFVSVHPIHPITGLSAFGGLAGAAVGYWWITAQGQSADTANRGPSADPLPNGGTEPSSVLPSRRVIIAGGMLLAFLFPTLFRVGGLVLTGEQWLFGPVITPGPTLVSLTILLGAVGLILGATVITRTPVDYTDRTLRQSVGVGYLLYATGIFLATGLAQSLWYPLIPSL